MQCEQRKRVFPNQKGAGSQPSTDYETWEQGRKKVASSFNEVRGMTEGRTEIAGGAQ